MNGANLSLRKVARRMNMDPSALSRTLSGERKMQVAEMRGLAGILRVSEVDIIAHVEARGADRREEGLSEMAQASYTDDPAIGRSAPSPRGGGLAEGPAISGDADSGGRKRHPLFGSLKGTTIIMPGVDLTEPADPDWGKVYDEDYDHGVVSEPYQKPEN